MNRLTNRANSTPNIVLRRMFQSGFIDREVYEKTRGEPIRIRRPPPEPNRAPYFVEHLKP